MTQKPSLTEFASENARNVTQPPVRWFTRFVLPMAILITAVLVLLLTGWNAFVPAREVTVISTAVRPVETMGMTREMTGSSIQAPGWVEADPFSTYASALTQGIVESILVLEGDTVKAGQPVATLIRDDAEIDLRRADTEVDRRIGLLQAAQATLDAAQADYENRVSVHRRVAIAEANAFRPSLPIAFVPIAFSQLRQRAVHQGVG